MNKVKYFSSSDLEKFLERFEWTRKTEEQWKKIFDSIRYVYGIKRGGVLPAYELAKRYNWIFLESLDDPSKVQPYHILIVDDIYDSGRTSKQFREAGFPCFFLHCKENRKIESKGALHFGEVISEDTWIEYFWENEASKDISETITRQIEFIGEDPNREGIVKTPERVVRSWKELYSGYEVDIDSFFNATFDRQTYDEMIILRNAQFYSVCEHHLLPFFGKAHIAYIPSQGGKIIGISKLARLLGAFARRMQIQERIGEQITNTLMEKLKPLGAACILEAEHLCMKMRGCKQHESTMITSSLKGVFNEHAVRNELLSIIRRG